MVPQLFYHVVIVFVMVQLLAEAQTPYPYRVFVMLVCAPLLGVVSLTPPFALSHIALTKIRVRVGVRVGIRVLGLG
jgi:hypothetical protein